MCFRTVANVAKDRPYASKTTYLDGIILYGYSSLILHIYRTESFIILAQSS